jgi:hypothetical protein
MTTRPSSHNEISLQPTKKPRLEIDIPEIYCSKILKFDDYPGHASLIDIYQRIAPNIQYISYINGLSRNESGEINYKIRYFSNLHLHVPQIAPQKLLRKSRSFCGN